MWIRKAEKRTHKAIEEAREAMEKAKENWQGQWYICAQKCNSGSHCTKVKTSSWISCVHLFLRTNLVLYVLCWLCLAAYACSYLFHPRFWPRLRSTELLMLTYSHKLGIAHACTTMPCIHFILASYIRSAWSPPKVGFMCSWYSIYSCSSDCSSTYMLNIPGCQGYRKWKSMALWQQTLQQLCFLSLWFHHW